MSGGGPTPNLPQRKPKNPAARKRFLDQLPLLNSDGENAPYAHPDFEGYPLGALIGILSDETEFDVTYCSTSHIDLGYVATNAHCVDRAVGADNYYVVFYDPQGVKRHAEVESIVYLGNSDVDDVAILKIPSAAALQWQTAGKTAKVVPAALATAENPLPAPLTFGIHVWAFDPIAPNYPDLMKTYTNGGMIFKPRTCQMTRTRPILYGAKVPSSGPIQRTIIRSKKGDPVLNFFVDQCDRNPIHGNSGSLVTVAEHFDEKVGVYHSGVGTKDGKEKYDYVEYTGSNGRTRFLHETADWQEIFGVGYLFEHFQITHPNVLF